MDAMGEYAVARKVRLSLSSLFLCGTFRFQVGIRCIDLYSRRRYAKSNDPSHSHALLRPRFHPMLSRYLRAGPETISNYGSLFDSW